MSIYNKDVVCEIMPQIPNFIGNNLDQFVKILPFELWLLVDEVLKNDFKYKVKALETKLELIKLVPCEYYALHWTGSSRKRISIQHILVNPSMIQFEVSYSSVSIHISQTLVTENYLYGYYNTTANRAMLGKYVWTGRADYIGSMNLRIQ